MIEIMLDTNACIRIIRDKPASVRKRFEAEVNELAISAIVYHELETGIARSPNAARHRAELDEFIPRVLILDFDTAAAVHAANIKANLLNRGCVIGPNDILIAGHARSLGLKLITGNLGEFSRVEGLRCEDWLG